MFDLPTINELAERSRLAFRRNLKGSDAWVWPNNVYASAKVIAGMVFEAFGFLSYVSRMIFAHTAPDIETLLMHGEEYGIARKPAAPAGGNVTFTVTNTLTVATGAILRRSDGVEYIVSAGGSHVGAGTLQVPVIATRDGAAGNALQGTSLEIVSGSSGAGASAATVAVGADNIVLGADIEGMEAYRARILFRKRNPPHGGSPSDYVLWASQVAGVTRVFVERLWAGPGSVRVFILMDGLFPDGIPDVAAVQRVQFYIDTVSPAGARVTVARPTAMPINVTVSNLQPNSNEVHNAVRAELADAFLRLGRVAGNDTPHGGMPFLAVPEIFSRSWVAQAVSNATGESRNVLVAPAADVSVPVGEIATLGTVSFI